MSATEKIKLTEVIAPAFYEVHSLIRSGDYNEFVEKGGRGGAKSSFISVEMLLLLLKNPEIHEVVFRKVGNTLRNSVYAQYCWAVAALGLRDFFNCTVSPMEITYKPTGQKIIFMGLDDPGKAKSIKVPFGYIGAAHFEELDQFAGAEEIRNVEQSIFRGGQIAVAFKSFNPPAAARNWANQYALEIKNGKYVHHSTYLTTPKEWLGSKFIADAEHLRDTNPTAYRHEYLGEVVGSGTQVFENLEIREITNNELKQFDRLYFGQDWGWYPDPNAFNGCYYSASTRTLYIFEEFRGCKYSNSRWAKLIEHHKCDLIVADPGSGGDRNVNDFKSYGFFMREAKKGPGSVEYSMKWLQGLAKIVIDPVRCPNTVKEFTEYEYERDNKTGEILTGYPDVANHHIDAVRYATEKIWKRRGS